MGGLAETLQAHVDDGSIPGAVALVAGGGEPEVAAVGSVDTTGTAPLQRDAIFRVASMTKMVAAAVTMMLVENGSIDLDSPVAQWCPELGSPSVVCTPQSPVDDVLPARRAITVEDLLTFRAGWGFPAQFDLPAVSLLFSELKQGSAMPQPPPEPDRWMATLAGIPLLYQPGEAWLYNVCSDILGVLLARATGTSLPNLFAERVFEPLGMVDSGFMVPAGKLDRVPSFYRPNPDGGLDLADPPAGEWSTMPAFPSGSGGLVTTLDDWYAFARMLLGQGTFDGSRLLPPESVQAMTTNQVTAAQSAAAGLFLEGQGWGYGGSVDLDRAHVWNVPGRYGWVGGTGTAAYVTPSSGRVEILMTQREMTGPSSTDLLHDFWGYAAQRH